VRSFRPVQPTFTVGSTVNRGVIFPLRHLRIEPAMMPARTVVAWYPEPSSESEVTLRRIESGTAAGGVVILQTLADIEVAVRSWLKRRAGVSAGIPCRSCLRIKLRS